MRGLDTAGSVLATGDVVPDLAPVSGLKEKMVLDRLGSFALYPGRILNAVQRPSERLVLHL